MEKASAAPPADTSDDLLLDLNTLVVRPEIAIDGVRYEILSPNEISVIESHRFGIWGKRIEELGGSPDPEAEGELNDLVNKVARVVGLGIPADVFTQLSGSHKWAIVDVFTGLLLRNRLGVAGAIAKAAGVAWTDQLIGGKSFPGSSVSTAEPRNGGWLKRLWRWFTLT